MATRSRQLALMTLCRLEARRAPTLADLLAATEIQRLPARDRAFLHQLVLGTLRKRGALDFALAPLLSRPIERLDQMTRSILRQGAFELLHTRVPARAAVCEAVALAKVSAPRSSGFVNAVMRRLAREGSRPFPDSKANPLDWLTSAGSLPRWLAERWVSRFGPDAAITRAAAFTEEPPVVFRINPHVANAPEQIAKAGLRFRPLLVPGAFETTEGRFADLAAEGVIYVQDQGSQLMAHLAAGPGLRLDACAAPGGKTVLMADLAGKTGTVVAGEAVPRRLRQLARLVAGWGSTNVRCVGADCLHLPFSILFDAVLVDAPCSGLGTLGRHPDIRWRARPEDLSRHAKRQAALLRAAARIVRDGGLLIYSVCSSESEECEDIVAAFLAEELGFQIEPPPPWTLPFADSIGLRTHPERHGGNAFFAVLLRHVLGRA